MINKPNMYRVHFQVMEGDNRAGGWADRFADIENLADVTRFSRITKVVPIYIEISDTSLTDTQIEEAIRLQEETQRSSELVNNVLAAQKALNAAEKALADANIYITENRGNYD